MKTNIPERIAALREAMKQHKIDAYIIPTSDPHMSEYPADCWKYREWISGFTGSAGTVIITADKAGLWTDSRYFLQASTQLEGTGIELFKMMLPETPTIPEFLTHELKEGQTVGLNGETYSLADARSLEKALAEKEKINRRQTDRYQQDATQGRSRLHHSLRIGRSGLDLQYQGYGRCL